MSFRGATITYNTATDVNLILYATIVVDVRSCDVGISRKRPYLQGAFQQIATLRQNQSRLAILATLRGVRRKDCDSAEDTLECVKRCLFVNKLLIPILYYDAPDLFYRAER